MYNGVARDPGAVARRPERGGLCGEGGPSLAPFVILTRELTANDFGYHKMAAVDCWGVEEGLGVVEGGHYDVGAQHGVGIFGAGHGLDSR